MWCCCRRSARLGLAVTTNLNINFLRKGQPGQDVLAAAKLLKLGKRLAVGEVNSAVGVVARSDRPCDGDLFHSKYMRLLHGNIAPYL